MGKLRTTQLDAVGTPPDVATQPINKYFCNLMNAIGVKAGADGFPVKGGTAPVTKFGKYDDTTLFRTDAPRDDQEPGRIHASFARGTPYASGAASTAACFSGASAGPSSPRRS